MFSLCESAGEREGRSTHVSSSSRKVGQQVLIVTVHPHAIELEPAAVFEPEIATRAIEGLTNSAKAGEKRAIHIERVTAIVAEGSQTDGGVVVRASWTRGLHLLANLRIALQIPTLDNIRVDVLRVSPRGCVIRAIYRGH